MPGHKGGVNATLRKGERSLKDPCFPLQISGHLPGTSSVGYWFFFFALQIFRVIENLSRDF